MEDNFLCFWTGNEKFYEQSCFKRFPRNIARGYGVEIALLVTDVEAYHRKVKAFAGVVSPLRLRPWGLMDFGIVDPFGYYLRVTSIHHVLDNSATLESPGNDQNPEGDCTCIVQALSTE